MIVNFVLYFTTITYFRKGLWKNKISDIRNKYFVLGKSQGYVSVYIYIKED